MADGEFIIYALCCPDSGDVRYIGLSSCGLKRARRHAKPYLLKKEKSHKSNWIRSLFASGKMYKTKILHICNHGYELAFAERAWIRYGRKRGWPLTNLTEGGDGIPGASPETRAKIGALSRARMATKEYQERAIGSRRGTKLPEWWRDNISKAVKGRKYGPEYGAAVSARQLGKKRGPLRITESEAVRRPARASLLGKIPWTDERRKKLSDA